MKPTTGIYPRLGVRHGINAKGAYTDLGGSSMSPAVWAAMDEANRESAEMPDLLRHAGERIAELMGCEAARVTPGASSAIVLSLAACMTGLRGPAMERLPETTGIPNRVLIQRGHRYKYDRMVRMSGADLIEVGDDTGTTPEDLAAAIDDSTAAVFLPAHLDAAAGTVSLTEVVSIAHASSVAVVVDAAYLIYPTDLMLSFARTGADGVIFSAKYFNGPNAGGFICGRQSLIEAVAAVDFTEFESGDYLIFGRPFKLDRWSVVATVAALEEWLTMDHAARFERYRRNVEAIATRVPRGAPLELLRKHFTMEEDVIDGPANCLVVRVLPEAPFTAHELHQALRNGAPAIFCHLRGDRLVFDVETITTEGDAEVIGDRLRNEVEGRLDSRIRPVRTEEGVGT